MLVIIIILLLEKETNENLKLCFPMVSNFGSSHTTVVSLSMERLKPQINCVALVQKIIIRVVYSRISAVQWARKFLK